MIRFYKYKALFVILLSICFSHNGNANQIDEIILKVNINNQPFIETNLKKGQTIYYLARQYNTDVKSIAMVNDLSDLASLQIGQAIKVPINPAIIFSENPNTIPPLQNRTPVFYIVKPKETLYRISKVYFDQPIENIMNLNNFTSFDLTVGQKIQLGWILHPVKPEQLKLQEELTSSLEEKPSDDSNEEVKDTINLYIKNKLFSKVDSLDKSESSIIKSRKEIAIWDKTAPNNDHMFALHRDAKKNSIIEIHNPLLNRTAFATVIGRVPPDSYTEDVTLIISPEVAKALGALDSRFMVEVKFYY